MAEIPPFNVSAVIASFMSSSTTGAALAAIGAAAASHTHAISEVTGLTSALAGKETAGAAAAALASANAYTDSLASSVTTALAGKAPSSHTHALADVTGLVDALAAKQEALNAGVNIRTINGVSPLGAGDMSVAREANMMEFAVAFRATSGVPVASAAGAGAVAHSINGTSNSYTNETGTTATGAASVRWAQQSNRTFLLLSGVTEIRSSSRIRLDITSTGTETFLAYFLGITNTTTSALGTKVVHVRLTNTTLELIAITGGVTTTAAGSTTITAGVEYTLELQLVGGVWTALLNGTAFATLSSGWDGAASYDLGLNQIIKSAGLTNRVIRYRGWRGGVNYTA